jgi:hypothetical protein
MMMLAAVVKAPEFTGTGSFASLTSPLPYRSVVMEKSHH